MVHTIELGRLIESGYDIGLKEYPAISEEYREQLNKKIINHYYFYEIGSETPSRFKHNLNSKMDEIMPYYNKLLQTELLQYNPLLSFTRTTTNTRTGTTESESRATNKNKSNASTDKTATGNNTVNDSEISGDMPKSLLTHNDLQGYASNASSRQSIGNNIDTESTTSTQNDETEGTSKSTGKLNEINTITENGHEIPVADLILKYRETFLRIEESIIKELKECFMLIF